MDMNSNVTFEINPNHELIVKLNQLRKVDPQVASLLVRQLLDNTMIASGMLNDSKNFVDRVYRLMNLVLDTRSQKPEKKAEPVREVQEDDESILKKKN
jgi:HSP90 family molecular chaperone